MTREEILAMEPGRELDALVAQKVMGWYEKSEGVWVSPVGFDDPHHYSTDISAAWEVLEKFKTHQVTYSENGFYQQSDMKYRVIIVKNKHVSYANTAPEAICKAALLAVLEEETK